MVTLTEEQAHRVESAVADAEARTSAEIAVCVFASSGDDRGLAAIAGAIALAAIESIGPAIWWNIDPLIWLGVAIVAAIVVFWLCDRFDLGLRCLPARMVVKDARRAARAAFLDNRIDDSPDRNGILLFVSRAEHYVEILPDRAAATAIAADQWAEIVEEFRSRARGGDVGEAVAGAVAKIGALCAAHFPAAAGDRDRVPNRPIQG
jgi:putative membrane protein